MPSSAEDLCQICNAPIEEPRVAVGLNSCWPCGAIDPNGPPSDVGPVWVGYDPGADLQ